MDSFRNRLMILFASLALFLGLAITLYIGHTASAQMSQASGQTLHLTAKNISNTLANSLTEREREIVLLSQSPFIVDMDFQHHNVQIKLDQVRNSYKYYAWLGIADTQGQVVVAAANLLTGINVAERPWFMHGLKQVYLGDVHQAVLLAKKIKAINPAEPLRFIDFAAPIYDPATKHVRGVLAAHADWSWAGHVLQTALPDHAAQKGIEVFIVNRQGEILYPFKSIGHVHPPSLSQSHSEFFIDQWHEGKNYLTVDVPVVSDTQMDLGWHVLIRQPETVALAEVRSLQQHIMLIGALVALLLLFMTWKLANNFSYPIEKLAKNAKAVESGQENIEFNTPSGLREIKTLSQSLDSMTETLLKQKHQLLDANATLEQKVMERTQALNAANIELEKVARYDALTEVYNRRALNEYLADLYSQFMRSQLSYAILLMDVDFFKKVNDNFGHDVGDHVLQRIAGILQSTVRETDFVARFGGEEFIVLLPATDLVGARVLAEKIRFAIAEAVILTEAQITVSIGVSQVQLADVDVHVALKRADQALYQAKQQGRNRVIVVI